MSNTAASQFTNNNNVHVILLMCRFARNIKGIQLSTNEGGACDRFGWFLVR